MEFTKDNAPNCYSAIFCHCASSFIAVAPILGGNDFLKFKWTDFCVWRVGLEILKFRERSFFLRTLLHSLVSIFLPLQKLLVCNPKERLPADQALTHAFFADMVPLQAWSAVRSPLSAFPVVVSSRRVRTIHWRNEPTPVYPEAAGLEELDSKIYENKPPFLCRGFQKNAKLNLPHDLNNDSIASSSSRGHTKHAKIKTNHIELNSDFCRFRLRLRFFYSFRHFVIRTIVSQQLFVVFELTKKYEKERLRLSREGQWYLRRAIKNNLEANRRFKGRSLFLCAGKQTVVSATER